MTNDAENMMAATKDLVIPFASFYNTFDGTSTSLRAKRSTGSDFTQITALVRFRLNNHDTERVAESL